MATKQPTDKSHFILPDLGEGVHEAELIKWCVEPGQEVAEHQTMAEMETDKALVEVPSPWSGVIKELKGNVGDIINVGSVLVTYETGADASRSRDAGRSGDASRSGDAASKPAPATPQDTRNGTAETPAETEDAGTVVGSVDGGLKVSDVLTRRRPDAAAGTSARGKAMATPAVRRIARERGIDINHVPGTGRGGRVTAHDVHAFAGDGTESYTTATATGARPAASTLEAPPVVLSNDGIAERVPFRGVRRRIAMALDRSVRTAVHFTVIDEADVTELDRRRREYARVLGRKLSLLPFVMTAVTRALRAHPTVNANVDDANSEILIRSVINLGCAVDTDHGLMVPVVAGADKLSVVELSDAVAALAAGCRDRTIEREKLIGGTFTISNVGSFGGMFATPIINYPEVGILAVGRAGERVLTRDGKFYAGRVLPLSMSCDHRVVDGAEGARFLNTVVRLLESPSELVGA